jgi:hypothetical protein
LPVFLRALARGVRRRLARDFCLERAPTQPDVADLCCHAAAGHMQLAGKNRKKVTNLYKLAAISLEVDFYAD